MLDNKNVDVESPHPSETGEQDDQTHEAASDDKTIKMQMTDLVDDVRKLAEAELEYYRIKLSVNMAATRTVVLLFSAAAVSAIVGAVALILGILLILTHYWGPVAATCLLTGAALLIATVLTNMALTRARKLPLDENDQ